MPFRMSGKLLTSFIRVREWSQGSWESPLSQIFLAVNKSSNVCGKFFCKESMLWLQKFSHCKPAYFHCIAIKSILDFNLMLTVVSGFVPFGSPMVSVFLIYEFSICNRNINFNFYPHVFSAVFFRWKQFFNCQMYF